MHHRGVCIKTPSSSPLSWNIIIRYCHKGQDIIKFAMYLCTHFIIIFICLLCVTVSACQNLGLCRYLTLGLCICIRDCLTPSKRHCWLWMFVLQIYSTDLESTSDLDCSCKRETQNIFKQQPSVEDSDLFWCKMRTVYELRKALIMDCHFWKKTTLLSMKTLVC